MSYRTPDADVYIHELGHQFGLDDLYSNRGARPAGDFSMQDSSSAGHDPFSCMQLNWVKWAYVPTESCIINIKDFQSSGDLIILSPGWEQDKSPFNEFFMLELYTPTGLNKLDSKYGPKAAGIRLWHINAVLNKKKNFVYDNDPPGFEIVFLAFGNDPIEVIPPGIFRVHNIRKDDATDDKKKLDYRCNYAIRDKNLFGVGDEFKAYDYRFQLHQYYEQVELNLGSAISSFNSFITFDNGKKIEWSFIVRDIQFDTTNETATASIELTRTNTTAS